MIQSQKDALRAVAMGAGYAVTLVVPNRFDRWIVDRLASLLFRLSPATVERRAMGIGRVLGMAPESQEALAIAREHYRITIASAWGRIRGTHRRGWKPEIQIEGLDKIHKALDRGKGVILWRWSFCSTPVVKIAMWRSGIPLVHLSREIHGAWSYGWIGRRVINPLYRRAEDCYLTERVVIPMDGSLAYMKTLLEHLNENAVVSIVGDLTGSQNVTVDLLDGKAKYATGAASLAWKTGATLLTVYAVAESRSGYRVVVDEPVEVDRSLVRKEFVRQAIAVFSERLQRAIERHPANWSHWGAFLDGEDQYSLPPDGAEPEAENGT